MSSVQRFIRQIPAHTQYYSAATVIASVATTAYELVPAAGNVVGNYPPGTMTAASAGSGVGLAILQAANALPNSLVLRDMGKTVRAALTANTAQVGFFRQVQLIAPAAITSYIGGASASSFGVLGSPAPGVDAYTSFQTFYIPIIALGASVNVAGLTSHNACQQ
jgi:hypothetical protein